MTKDDVIRLAREAGMVYREFEDEFANANTDGVDLETMTDFAKLVAEHERKEFAVHAVDIARRAIAEERDACAKVCEAHGSTLKAAVWVAEECAAAIRARGQT